MFYSARKYQSLYFAGMTPYRMSVLGLALLIPIPVIADLFSDIFGLDGSDFDGGTQTFVLGGPGKRRETNKKHCSFFSGIRHFKPGTNKHHYTYKNILVNVT